MIQKTIGRFLQSALALNLMHAWAETDYSSYVQLTTSETTMSAWTNGVHWSDGNPPVSSQNYYVPAGRQMYLLGNSSGALGTWGGGELAIAGTLQIYVSNQSTFAPTIPNLVLLDNATLDMAFAYSGLRPGSGVTVRSAASTPALMDYTCTYTSTTDYGVSLYAEFTGSPDVGLRMTRSKAAQPGMRAWRSASTTWQNYQGTLTLTGAAAEFRMIRNATLNFAGTLIVENGATLYPVYQTPDYVTTSANITNLTIRNGGVLQTLTKDGRVYPQYNVSGAFSAADAHLVCDLRGGVTRLFPGATSTEDATSYGVKLINLTGTAAQNAAADVFAGLTLSLTNNLTANTLSAFPPLTPLRKAESDGSVALYLGCTNLVRMNVNNGSSEGLSAFNAANGSYWSDGVVPSPESDKTYYASHLIDVKEDPLLMPYAKFIFGTTAYWNVGTEDKAQLQVKELHFLPGSSLHCWSYLGRRTITAEKIVIYGASGVTPCSINANGGKHARDMTYIWNAPFYGEGDFWLRNRGYAPEVSHSFVGNDNSSYTGRLIIGNSEGATNDTIVTRLRIGAAQELGGAVPEEVAWKAVELFGYGALEVTNDVTLAATDRALYFNDRARLITTNNATLTLNNSLTFNGTVTKLASGTLTLAGEAPRFLDATTNLTTTPRTGLNRLDLKAGSLKIGAVDAAQGLEINMAEGTRLVLDAAATGDLARYGLRNTAWDKPFVLPASGVLPVAITGEASALRLTLGLCTISAAAETALNLTTASFAITAPHGYRATTRQRTVNEDGSITYSATLVHKGLSISLR